MSSYSFVVFASLLVLSLSPAPSVFNMSMKLPLSMDFNTAWGEMDMQSYMQRHGICSTVNREIFIIEIFSDTMDNLKIKHLKKLCTLLTLIQYRVFVQKLFNM